MKEEDMSENKELYLNFDEYIRQGEPAQRERAEAWRVAIGLQAVDGLKTSEYLQETARKNIEGEITIDEARERVKQYYIKKTAHGNGDEDKEEADLVSGNISKLLQTDAFTYSVAGLSAIHKAIFEGVFKHAGRFRDYDISKKEWVLRGDSVLYGRWQDLRMAIEYDLEQERQFDYTSLNKEQMVEHLAKFVAGLWQIHPFGEGNTRTTAVFTIKYLRSQGFDVNNDLFERHSWYFRNALVRANYRNLNKNINYEPLFLVRFFRNLLLGENNTLKNRYMIVNPPEDWKMPESEQVQDMYRTSTGQVQDKLYTDNHNIISLIKVISDKQLSVKEMMYGLNLKGRDNFLTLYLIPSIEEGYVRLLYPDKPRHPRQKYLLTVKGLVLYKNI
ncbi:Fido, protein-threonine AMPylation domain-containing protein [Prevotella sp. ne3005]|uniref:Fic family protein n=1 Tax=Prevotella sp. ne3005 TaxID=1761887 RepID=UPI0008BC0CEA|nr:Fic family protein [Prevotella sp. ne3005]SEN31422.1 Fido, protein-threonine AMPylation domain-containing protein [Prevotella sp. ne3005]